MPGHGGTRVDSGTRCPFCELLALERERSQKLNEIVERLAAVSLAVERLTLARPAEGRSSGGKYSVARSTRPPERLGIADLEARLGLDRKTIGNWVKAGKLPGPHYLGEVRRWWTQEIVAWELMQMAPTRPRKRSERSARPE